MMTLVLANARIVYKVKARSHRQCEPDDIYNQNTVNLVGRGDGLRHIISRDYDDLALELRTQSGISFHILPEH